MIQSSEIEEKDQYDEENRFHEVFLEVLQSPISPPNNAFESKSVGDKVCTNRILTFMSANCSLDKKHLLISGDTGVGKSAILNHIIHLKANNSPKVQTFERVYKIDMRHLLSDTWKESYHKGHRRKILAKNPFHCFIHYCLSVETTEVFKVRHVAEYYTADSNVYINTLLLVDNYSEIYNHNGEIDTFTVQWILNEIKKHKHFILTADTNQEISDILANPKVKTDRNSVGISVKLNCPYQFQIKGLTQNGQLEFIANHCTGINSTKDNTTVNDTASIQAAAEAQHNIRHVLNSDRSGVFTNPVYLKMLCDIYSSRHNHIQRLSNAVFRSVGDTNGRQNSNTLLVHLFETSCVNYIQRYINNNEESQIPQLFSTRGLSAATNNTAGDTETWLTHPLLQCLQHLAYHTLSTESPPLGINHDTLHTTVLKYHEAVIERLKAPPTASRSSRSLHSLSKLASASMSPTSTSTLKSPSSTKGKQISCTRAVELLLSLGILHPNTTNSGINETPGGTYSFIIVHMQAFLAARHKYNQLKNKVTTGRYVSLTNDVDAEAEDNNTPLKLSPLVWQFLHGMVMKEIRVETVSTTNNTNNSGGIGAIAETQRKVELFCHYWNFVVTNMTTDSKIARLALALQFLPFTDGLLVQLELCGLGDSKAAATLNRISNKVYDAINATTVFSYLTMLNGCDSTGYFLTAEHARHRDQAEASILSKLLVIVNAPIKPTTEAAAAAAAAAAATATANDGCDGSSATGGATFPECVDALRLLSHIHSPTLNASNMRVATASTATDNCNTEGRKRATSACDVLLSTNNTLTANVMAELPLRVRAESVRHMPTSTPTGHEQANISAELTLTSEVVAAVMSLFNYFAAADTEFSQRIGIMEKCIQALHKLAPNNKTVHIALLSWLQDSHSNSNSNYNYCHSNVQVSLLVLSSVNVNMFSQTLLDKLIHILTHSKDYQLLHASVEALSALRYEIIKRPVLDHVLDTLISTVGRVKCRNDQQNIVSGTPVVRVCLTLLEQFGRDVGSIYDFLITEMQSTDLNEVADLPQKGIDRLCANVKTATNIHITWSAHHTHTNNSSNSSNDNNNINNQELGPLLLSMADSLFQTYQRTRRLRRNEAAESIIGAHSELFPAGSETDESTGLIRRDSEHVVQSLDNGSRLLVTVVSALGVKITGGSARKVLMQICVQLTNSLHNRAVTPNPADICLLKAALHSIQLACIRVPKLLSASLFRELLLTVVVNPHLLYVFTPCLAELSAHIVGDSIVSVLTALPFTDTSSSNRACVLQVISIILDRCPSAASSTLVYTIMNRTIDTHSYVRHAALDVLRYMLTIGNSHTLVVRQVKSYLFQAKSGEMEDRRQAMRILLAIITTFPDVNKTCQCSTVFQTRLFEELETVIVALLLQCLAVCLTTGVTISASVSGGDVGGDVSTEDSTCSGEMILQVPIVDYLHSESWEVRRAALNYISALVSTANTTTTEAEINSNFAIITEETVSAVANLVYDTHSDNSSVAADCYLSLAKHMTQLVTVEMLFYLFHPDSVETVFRVSYLKSLMLQCEAHPEELTTAAVHNVVHLMLDTNSTVRAQAKTTLAKFLKLRGDMLNAAAVVTMCVNSDVNNDCADDQLAVLSIAEILLLTSDLCTENAALKLVKTVVTKVHCKHRAVSIAAVELICKLCEALPGLVPSDTLCQLVRYEDADITVPQVSLRLLTLIAAITPININHNTVKQVLKCLYHTQIELRKNAVNCLLIIAQHCTEHSDYILHTLFKHHSQISGLVAMIASSVGYGSTKHFKYLIYSCGCDCEHIRRHAMALLQTLSVDRIAVLTTLKQLIKDAKVDNILYEHRGLYFSKLFYVLQATFPADATLCSELRTIQASLVFMPTVEVVPEQPMFSVDGHASSASRYYDTAKSVLTAVQNSVSRGYTEKVQKIQAKMESLFLRCLSELLCEHLSGFCLCDTERVVSTLSLEFVFRDLITVEWDHKHHCNVFRLSPELLQDINSRPVSPHTQQSSTKLSPPPSSLLQSSRRAAYSAKHGVRSSVERSLAGKTNNSGRNLGMDGDGAGGEGLLCAVVKHVAVVLNRTVAVPVDAKNE